MKKQSVYIILLATIIITSCNIVGCGILENFGLTQPKLLENVDININPVKESYKTNEVFEITFSGNIDNSKYSEAYIEFDIDFGINTSENDYKNIYFKTSEKADFEELLQKFNDPIYITLNEFNKTGKQFWFYCTKPYNKISITPSISAIPVDNKTSINSGATTTFTFSIKD
ncbi:MAG: hypothetical protein K6E78_01285 [Treponema sp.]|nr:hypothetical protein [Treponema sp.]